MKANLFIQFILSIFVLLFSMTMMAAAFAMSAPAIWKVCTGILVIVSVSIIKQVRKEIKQ